MSADDRKQRMLRSTLDRLGNTIWGPPEVDSYLATTCRRLRTIPLGQFTAGVWSQSSSHLFA